MVNGTSRVRTIRTIGIGMVILGVLLILSFSALYITGVISYSQLNDLNSEIIVANHLPSKEIYITNIQKEISIVSPISQAISVELNNTLDGVKESAVVTKDLPKLDTRVSVPVKNSPRSTKEFNQLISGYSSPKLVKNVHPKDWANPMWSEGNIFEPYKTKGFLYDQEQELSIGPVLSIQIPSIGVNSKVENLSIVEKNGRKSYETPKNIVGRIPTNEKFAAAVPGWFFGHLESPIKGEGNIFHDLPEVADHLRNGDPVYVHLQNKTREFVYIVTKSEVLHKSELELYDLGMDSIMLVTCSNRPYYDHRQLVTAKLIDIK